jgi:hypothetical protein
VGALLLIMKSRKLRRLRLFSLQTVSNDCLNLFSVLSCKSLSMKTNFAEVQIPPDGEARAIDLFLEQAETLSEA